MVRQELTFHCLNCGHQTSSGKEMDEHIRKEHLKETHGRMKMVRNR